MIESPLADPLTALIAFVKADPYVAEIVGTRVFGDELPRAEVQAWRNSQPRPAVVLAHSGAGVGGVEAGSYAPISTYRIDVWNYGPTPFEAARLRLTTFRCLKYLERQTIAFTLLYSAERVSGPLTLRDPDGDWPVKIETFQLLAADTSLAA